MKCLLFGCITGTVIFAVLALPAQVNAQDQEQLQKVRFPHYKVKDLGTLGGSYSYGFGISSIGLVGGAAATPSQTDGLSATAFLWRRGQMIDLGTLGGPNSGASVVNASGEVALSA